MYVLDRRESKAIPSREASHHRMIAPESVKEEMTRAGFILLDELPPPADERFLMVFGKKQ